jgi:hypothetical protein
VEPGQDFLCGKLKIDAFTFSFPLLKYNSIGNSFRHRLYVENTTATELVTKEGSPGSREISGALTEPQKNRLAKDRLKERPVLNARLTAPFDGVIRRRDLTAPISVLIDY